MRKIIYILLFPLLWGCDSILDVEPENAITFTNFIKTEEDFNAMVFQMEGFFRYKQFENEVMAYRGFLADQVNSSYYEDQRMLNQTSLLNSFSNSWKNHYDLIYVANVILDNLYRAEGVPQDKLDFYAGQAYFVKGFVYFDLARKWGDAVITKNSTDMGVYDKSSMLDVLDEAIKNTSEGYKLLPKYEDMPLLGVNTWVSKQYGCKGSCAALLAHLYAWKGSMIELCGMEGDAKKCYEESIEWSTLLIEKKVGFYELERTSEDVCTKAMKGMGASLENILEFELDRFNDYPMAYFPGKSYMTWPVRGTETPGSVVTKTFVIKAETVKNLYENRDDRRDEYFYKLDSMSHDTMYKVNQGYAYVYKWREVVYENVSWSPTPQVAYVDANYSYWRLADIYLLRAECYAKLNDDLAKADLNKIRDRANATPYPAPGESDIQLAIFKERERELLFEGHRYFDIIRNGLEYIHTYMDGNYKTLDQQDVKEGALFLPLYTDAFTLNDLIRQNIYWSRFE